MKKLMENFNKYLTQEDLVDFRFEAILISSSTKERGKDDILSDIRSLPGVTVVAVREADKPKPGRDYSVLSLKVDRLVLGHASIPSIIKDLIKKVNRLAGVYSLSLKGLPEPL